MGWVEGRDGVVAVVCVGSVRDGRRAMGCVCELDVAGSGVAFGEWRLGVGPVWGLMVGVDAVVRQRWMLCVGLVGWLPVWCGRCIEAVLFVSVGVMV